MQTRSTLSLLLGVLLAAPAVGQTISGTIDTGQQTIDRLSYRVLDEVRIEADGDDENTYDLFKKNLGKGALEVPDRFKNNHPGTRHIRQRDGSPYGPYFRFVIHRDDRDRDRFPKTTDRQRNEIKAYDKSVEAAQGERGETVRYHWYFRLADDLPVTRGFSHFMQIKAYDRNGGGLPILTISGYDRPRRPQGRVNRLEIRHTESNEAASTTLAACSWEEVRGQWLEAEVIATYADDGYLRVSISNEDGQTLLSTEKSGIDLWRDGAEFNRPKWGIYRSLEHRKQLVNEVDHVDFADFSIQEILLHDAAVLSDVQLTLPGELYAVPGVEMSVYFDNVVVVPNSDGYQFAVECDLGRTEQRRWTVTSTTDQVGKHKLAITVNDCNGKQIAEAATVVRVVAADAGVGRSIRLLIVGDSLTNATQYPNEIARLLSMSDNPDWRMLGTHRPKSAAEGVAHEGYGGWTWKRFTSYYDPKPKDNGRKHHSPLVYLDDSMPRLDVRRYITEQCDGNPPDYVVFLLGINDCFHAPPDALGAIDARIDAMIEQADILLKEFGEAAPNAEFGVCLTTPPNSREAAFEANYKGRYTRWGWKRIQHRVVQRQLAHFGAKRTSHVFIVPTQLNLDPIDGYPVDNGVHPNATGYKQIGASIYSWLKWRLHHDDQS